MPLIDYTFFVDELKIPNTDKVEVLEELIRFIAKYEDKFLTELLGYEMYRNFKTALADGLTSGYLDPRWTELLSGAEYDYGGITRKYKGLIEDAVVIDGSINGTSLSGYQYKAPVFIKGGSAPGVIAGAIDTIVVVANTSSVTLPGWIGWEPIIEKIGFGTQVKGLNYNYNKSTGKWDLLGGSIFDLNEYYFAKFMLAAPVSISIDAGSNKKSMIANYIYYWWMRNRATDTSGIGEVYNKAGNATRTSPSGKMCAAWNEMVDMIWQLVSFMNANAAYYDGCYLFNNSNYYPISQYHRASKFRDIFYPINAFNL